MSLDDEKKIAWEAFLNNQKEAHRAHDSHREFSLEMFRSVIAFGLEAIRTSVFVNGGALVAGLALMGSVYEADPALARNLIGAVLFFAGGVGLAGAGASAAYVTQWLYQASHDRVTHTWSHPFIEEQPGGFWWKAASVVAHIAAVVLIAGSYGATIWGAWTAVSAFSLF